jgi:hypothetical protein
MMLVFLVYLMIFLTFFVFTLGEGIKKQAEWDAYRISGLVACFFWPCVLLLGVREALAQANEG